MPAIQPICLGINLALEDKERLLSWENARKRAQTLQLAEGSGEHLAIYEEAIAFFRKRSEGL